MGRIEVWARPGSRREGIEWDEWRHRWVVSCREPPMGGRANEAILALLADRLGVPRPSVRYVVVGRARAKQVEVDGLTDADLAERLRGLGSHAIRS